MARSTYVYMMASDNKSAAFTVKHEAVTWASRLDEEDRQGLGVVRYKDGGHGEPEELDIYTFMGE